MSTLQTEKDPILIDLPMPVETPRLVLRPVMAGDGAATAEAIAETWDDLHRWMLWAEKKEDNTTEKQEIRARKVHAQFILREDIGIIGVEKESGRPVIWTGFHRFDWKLRRIEIGYWVRKSAQRRGYATESANALTRYAFAVLGARRVDLDHAEGNDASRRVMEKLGFEKEAIRARALLLPGDKAVDRHCYVRLSPDGLPPLDVRWGPP